MNAKNWMRVAVITALLAWPGTELYRLGIAKQKLAASEQLAQSVSQKLAMAHSPQP